MRIIVLLLMLLPFLSIAQKVDNKKGVTYIDEKPYLKIKGGSLAVANQPAQILNYSNDKLLFVITVHLLSSDTWYNEVTFADFDFSFKTKYLYRPLVKSLYENKVLNETGEITQESVEKWYRLFGNPPPADWDF